MKAKLIFNLPEDNLEYNRCNKSLDMALALFDISQLRFNLEMENKLNIKEMTKGINDIYSKYNINLDELIE
jgi:hypothetical protein